MARNYHLGNVKPHVAAAAAEVGERFDYRSIGGWRAVGSVPNSDHPKGLALDFMTLSRAKGDATVEYLIQNADRLGIKYVIYWRRIWQNGKWEEYDGPSPHIDHVHASFNATGGDPTTGGVSAGSGNPLDPSNWPVVGQVERLSATLQSPDYWRRVGLYGLGFALIMFGFFIVFRRPMANAIETGIKVVK